MEFQKPLRNRVFTVVFLKEMSASSGAYSRLMALKDMGVVEVNVRISSNS